jgi:hypothetical protein
MADGSIQTPLSKNCGETPTSVYIHLNKDRWEGCGYYQDPVLSATSVLPSNSLSAIVQIDIEPVVNIRTLVDALPVKSAAEPLYTDDEPIEGMVNYICETASGYMTFIEDLSLYTRVFGVPRNEFLRPSVNKFIDKQAELMEIAKVVFSDVGKNFTEAEELVCRIIWAQRTQETKQKNKKDLQQKNNKSMKQKNSKNIKQEDAEDVKQKDIKDAELREYGEAEQKGDEEAEQKDTETSQEHSCTTNESGQDKGSKEADDEGAKQKEREDAEQKEREEAIAIATSYAEQDRYDSCSDSEED